MTKFNNQTSVFLVVLDGENKSLKSVLEVGSILLAKLLRTHAQFEDYPLTEAEGALLEDMGQCIYRVGDMDYLHSLVGAMIKLPYDRQIQLRTQLLQTEDPDCYLVISG